MQMDGTCRTCGQVHACHSIYYRLGHNEGPSVVSKVLVAFGVPMAVFIATLAVSDALLAGTTSGREGPTLLSFVLALTLTAVVVLAIWRRTQRPSQHGDAADEVQR